MFIVFSLFLIGLLAFAIQTWCHINIIKAGQPVDRQNFRKERLKWMFKTTLGHKRIAERSWGWAHIIIFWSFFVFLTSGLEMLVSCVIDGFTWAQLVGTTAHGILCIIQTWFAWATLIALAFVSGRRIWSKQTFTNNDAIFILVDIFLMMISHIVGMSALIQITKVAPFAATLMPLEKLAAPLFGSYAELVRTVCVIAHLSLMSIFLFWIPNSKHLHIFLAWFDTYYAYPGWRTCEKGVPVEPGTSRRNMDSEAMRIAANMARNSIGAKPKSQPNLTKLIKNPNLCPEIHPSGVITNPRLRSHPVNQKKPKKVKAPKRLPIYSPASIDFEAYEDACCRALDAGSEVLPTIGLRDFSDTTQKQRLEAFSCTLCRRCTNVCPMVNSGQTQNGPMDSLISLRKLCIQAEKTKANPALLDDIMPEKDLWNCTLCGACDQACPLSHEHTLRIMMMRQNAVAQQTGVPQKLTQCYNSIERNGNPWGYPARERSLFLHSAFHKTARIVIFAGCMASYDKSASKTLNAVIAWLEHAGFEVMTMTDETCCGEPLRMTGNEMGFQTQAKENIKKLKATKAQLVLTTCPHCAFTLSDSYRAFGFTLPTMHIVEFWGRLLEAGKLSFKTTNEKGALALHMPCLLSKKFDETDHTVKLLSGLGYDVRQTDDSRRASCCGAGGGQFFFTNDRTITQKRVQELNKLNAKFLGTLCPFCTQTLADTLQISSVGTLTTCVNVIDSLASGVEFKSR